MKTTSAPIEFFNLFCDNNFFVQICQEANFYNVQPSTDGFMETVLKNNKRHTSFKRLKSVTVSEIKQAIGIILYMGICKLPNQRMYWGSWAAVPIISESMTRNRFEDIVSTLHFNDNEKVAAEGQNGHDKLHKIQLLVDHYKKMFSNSVIPATYQANNEMMVQFKGYHGLKMYKPKKLVKWWYKIWSCAGISGYVYGFWSSRGKRCKRATRKCSASLSV